MKKSTQFLGVKNTPSTEDYAKFYIPEVVRLHGVPVLIISDRGAQFTAQFWKCFQKNFCPKVNLSTAFHPQMDGQAKRNIQTIENILRSCVINFKRNLADQELSLRSSTQQLPFKHPKVHMKYFMGEDPNFLLIGLKLVNKV